MGLYSNDAVQTPTSATGQQFQSFQAVYGPLLAALTSQIQPTGQAIQNAQNVLAPQAAQEQYNIFSQFAPEMNQLGAQIAQQNQLAQSGTNLAQLQQYGQPIGQAALAAQQAANPNFFANQARENSALGNLFGNLPDTGAGLAPSQTAEIQRYLNRNNAANGLTAPTSLNTVSNAMTFGQAGLQNQQQKQQMVENAIQTASGAAGSLQSGINAPAMATPGQAFNTGGAALSGPQTPGLSETFGSGSQLWGTTSGAENQFNNLMASKPTTLNQLTQVSSLLGDSIYGNKGGGVSLGGGASGGGGGSSGNDFGGEMSGNTAGGY